jgi:hypothetical protein
LRIAKELERYLNPGLNEVPPPHTGQAVRIGTISTATTIALRCLVGSERIRDRTESGL